jgi:hypothetical protein
MSAPDETYYLTYCATCGTDSLAFPAFGRPGLRTCPVCENLVCPACVSIHPKTQDARCPHCAKESP